MLISIGKYHTINQTSFLNSSHEDHVFLYRFKRTEMDIFNHKVALLLKSIFKFLMLNLKIIIRQAKQGQQDQSSFLLL